MPPLRIFLDALGCRLNQAELERMGAQLRQAGHVLVADPVDCDWAVLNSCAVTHRAVRDGRARIRSIRRANPRARVAVTGCWSTLEAAEVEALPGVALLVPNEHKHDLPARLGASPSPSPTAREPLPGPRRRARAFVKVQDGCDQACAYCTTTLARGPSRSVPVERVLADLRAAARGGAREAVITGVQLSGWGTDLPGQPTIGDLLDALLAAPLPLRIRLSSLEPWSLPEDLFERWSDRRLCRQLHLPFQAGCDATLARMRRPYRRAQAEALLRRARAIIPGLALSTDVLVGFPGETEAEFAETLSWLDDLALVDAHVFTYSPRPGTAAARLPDPVPPAVAKQRRLELLEVVQSSRRAFLRGLVGETLEVVWVAGRAGTSGGWRLEGVTEHGVRVFAESLENLWSLASSVRILALEGRLLAGEIVDPHPSKGRPTQ